MTGQVQTRRWIWRSRGVIAAGAVAATVGAGIFAAWPASGSVAGTRQPAGGAPSRPAIPRHWAPVPWRAAQLAVPGNWIVESAHNSFCSDGHEGIIFAGVKPRIPKGQGCRRPAGFAWILPAETNSAPGGGPGQKPFKINGFQVYRLSSAKDSVVYQVPKLGVRIGARGPHAKRILGTLSQSPLSVVLAKGPASPVPAHWAWRKFGGIKFATPRAWPTRQSIQWATCGTGVDPSGLLLLNAKKPPEALPCPFPYPSAENFAAVPGLAAVIGKFAAKSVDESYPRCQVRNGARICLSSATGTGGLFGGVLIFSVARPHHHPAGFFLLGLSGTGRQARAIFDSISLG